MYYENAKNVSGKDKVRILKDFGEILCALYAFKYFKNENIMFVEFPTRANEPLIDFKCYSKDKEIANVSVKSGTSGSGIGASPSVNSISDLVQEAKNGKGKAKIYVNEENPILSDKARTLGGYVIPFNVRQNIIDKILEDNPEIV